MKDATLCRPRQYHTHDASGVFDEEMQAMSRFSGSWFGMAVALVLLGSACAPGSPPAAPTAAAGGAPAATIPPTSAAKPAASSAPAATTAPQAAAPASAVPTAGAAAAANPAGIADAAKTHTFDWGQFKLAQRILDKAAKGETINVVVDNQGTAIPIFGAEQKIGTDRGCAASKPRLTIGCRLTGPATSDTNAQLSELETLLSSNQVDCLGIQSATPNEFVDIINKYVEAGIPVFTENTDVPSSKRFALAAINEREAGKMNGVATANIVKAKGYKVQKVAMGSGGPDAPWAQDRMAGFAEGYRTVFPDTQFAQNEKNGLPTGKDYTTEEVVSSVGPYLSANSDVNLFFHTDQGVEGVGLVIKDKGMNGKVWTSGFNVSLQLLDLMDDGIILTTIDQGFDRQAEAAVTRCVDFLTSGKLPEGAPLAYIQPTLITKDGENGAQSSAKARENLTAVLAR